MLDTSHLITMGALGAGGLAAGAMAGWQRVKNAFSYVSSFAFVSAQFDSDLLPAIRAYVHTNYTILPSGLFYYASRRFKLRGNKQYSVVPFKLPMSSSIYFRGCIPFFIDLSSNKIRSIRGFTNFNTLVSDALDQWEARNNNSKEVSRFYVHQVMGMDKSTHGMDWEEKRSRGDDSPQGATAEISSSSNWHEPDINVHASFKYARDLYLPSPKDQDPLDGLFFDEHVIKYFDQAQRWLEMGEWYIERNIPWRRGWLLHGPGGTGKSSVAKALARKLGIPIYQYYLATLSDNEFIKKWNNMATPCIALLEDFDAVFNMREPLTEHKSLTFDTVLNTISGVNSLDGVMLIVTTNHLDKIDPALGISVDDSEVSTRPGRVDTVIKIGYMSEYNRTRMASRMLRDWPELVNPLLRANTGTYTPAQWQEICLQAALERMAADDHKVLSISSNRGDVHARQIQTAQTIQTTRTLN